MFAPMIFVHIYYDEPSQSAGVRNWWSLAVRDLWRTVIDRPTLGTLSCPVWSDRRVVDIYHWIHIYVTRIYKGIALKPDIVLHLWVKVTSCIALHKQVSYIILLSCLWPKGKVTTTLTHWGRERHICVSKLTIIGSNNGLSPGRRQAIIWTNAGILLIRPLGTNFNEMLVEIRTFSFMKMRLKVSSAKWRSFCLGLNELIHTLMTKTSARIVCLFHIHNILCKWLVPYGN